MTTRRDFITLLGGIAVSLPIGAYAQLGARMRRIGAMMLLAEDDPQQKAWTEAFLQGLQEAGWTDRSNIQIDYRWGAGDAARARRYAAELVALAPDVILAPGSAGLASGRYSRSRHHGWYRSVVRDPGRGPIGRG
jgi:putative tryptophan/tyrosine transport system substrate-binding protein